MSKLPATSNLSRDKRVDLSWKATSAAGVSGTVCAATTVLAVVGVVGFGIPILAAGATGAFAYSARKLLK